MKSKARFLFPLLFMLVCGCAASAQDVPSHVLVDLAALLPASVGDMIVAEGERPYTNVTFLDLAALRTAFPNDDLTAEESPTAQFIVGPRSLSALFQAELEGMETVMGFSLSDVHQALIYGNPPGQLMILQGEFDGDALRSALTALGFAVESVSDGYTRFCNPDGCDQATQVDVSSANQGNPFGGNVGRREAIALIEREDTGADLLIGTSYAPLFEAAVARAMQENNQPLSDISTLYAAEAIASAANAAEDATLIAAAMFAPEWIEGESVDSDNALSPYDALVIAAFHAPGAAPYTVIALVYRDGSQAESVAAAMSARLAEGTPSHELLAANGISIGETSTLPLSEGGAAFLLTLQSAESGDSAYPLIMQMIEREDAGWLVP